MLHKFSAKNFYSFKDEVEVNFQVNEKAPETNGYVKGVNGSRVSKMMAVIGPNASGKTNLLKIITFLQFLITDSFKELKPNESIPFDPYLFVNKSSAPTELSVTFSCKENLYDYFIQLNKEQIFEEKLRIYNNLTKQFNILYTRVWNKEENNYDYNLRNFDLSESLVTKRKNATLLAAAFQAEQSKVSQDIVACWNKLVFNVVQFGRHDHHDEWIFEAAEFYNNNPEIKKKAEKLLTRFDLGLTKLDIEKHTQKSKSGKDETLYIPVGFHKDNEQEYPLSFIYESSGTQHLFTILRGILLVLDRGGTAVFDELDADLHPHMLPELIDLFLSKEHNPKNAQLIFTSHHHEILNKLDKYQIVLTERDNESGGSETWRLDEIKGVRPDDNYYAKYIAGVYGGVPEL